MTEGGYKRLEVYRVAHDLAVRIHKMTLSLPRFETYEEAAQVRRSSKRVSASIVEGHALRRYKANYLSYLYRALASADETQEHLELLRETGSLTDKRLFDDLLKLSRDLSKMLTRFIQGVEREHGTARALHGAFHEEAMEPPTPDDPDAEAARELRRRHLESGIGDPGSRTRE